MCLQPESAGGGNRIDTRFVPPSRFVATAMDLTVVSATERDSKFVADLAAKCRWLREPQVMGVGRPATTDQTGLPGNRFDMPPVANASWYRQGQHGFIHC
jgi:hypothetical protein